SSDVKATVTSRLINRPIRPLFPDGFRNEVQVISTVMSVDQDKSPEMAAMIGSSVALSISDIPFEEPIAGVNVGLIDGEFIINPTIEQQEKSEIELTVAGTKDAINMVEAGANEVTEDVMLEAIMFGHKEIARLVEFQEKIVEAVGKEKASVTLFNFDDDLAAKVESDVGDKLNAAIQVEEKHAREEAIDQVTEEIKALYEDDDEEVYKQVGAILDQMVKDGVR